MTGDLAFFSFVELTDQTQHRAYNEWHQLDHLPENRAQPGVAWGDRWGRPDAYKEAASSAPQFSGVDYIAMYWLREPLVQSKAAWNRLAEDSFQWGRGPFIPGVERRLLAWFNPVKGYTSPRALVAPNVIPIRPHQGVHITLSRIKDRYATTTHANYAWEDRVLIPDLLEVPGVAGAWTLSFAEHLQNTLPFGDTEADEPGQFRARILYLDGDPIAATNAIKEAETALAAAADTDPADVRDVVFSSPAKTMIPWQDW